MTLKDGIAVKIICGEIDGTKGPVSDIVVDTEYFDVTVPAGARLEHHVKDGYTVFAYVYTGTALFGTTAVKEQNLALFNRGGKVSVESKGKRGVRFILVSGKPIGEPVAWRGPIVMNTEEELHTAFVEYQNGTFLKQ